MSKPPDVREELLRREPLFHRVELGTTRAEYEKMIVPTFWEVGASGRRYSREYILGVLEERNRNQTPDPWKVQDFECIEVAPDNYLATYTLVQDARVTRRATLWRRDADGWRAVYHQGTVVSSQGE
jgi:hypothetical protein